MKKYFVSFSYFVTTKVSEITLHPKTKRSLEFGNIIVSIPTKIENCILETQLQILELMNNAIKQNEIVTELTPKKSISQLIILSYKQINDSNVN